MTIVWWLIDSKLGRAVALAFAIIVGVAAVALKAFTAGKRRQMEIEKDAALREVNRRIQVREDVSRMSRGDVDRELRKWSRR